MYNRTTHQTKTINVISKTRRLFRIKFVLPVMIALSLLISGCQARIGPVSRAVVPAAPSGVSPVPFGLNSLTYKNPEITSHITYSLQTWRCGLDKIGMEEHLSGRDIQKEELRTLFNRTLESAGYDIAGNRGWLFDDDRDVARAQYGIDADIDLVTMDLCHEETFFPRRTGISGHALVRVGWTIRQLPNGEQVGKIITRGYAHLPSARKDGQIILFERAFAAAAHNLGAHNQLYALVYGRVSEDVSTDAELVQPQKRSQDMQDPSGFALSNQPVSRPTSLSTMPRRVLDSAVSDPSCAGDPLQAGDVMTIIAAHNGQEKPYPALLSASGSYTPADRLAGLSAADILLFDSPKAPYPLYGYAVDDNDCVVAVSAPSLGKAGKTSDGLYLFLRKDGVYKGKGATSAQAEKQAKDHLNNNETIRPLDLLAE